ncbi:MAG: hypothetical protein AAFZ04_02250 [Pseudomonadota bacterium]
MQNAIKTIVARPRLLFRPDPVLGWSLTPGHGVEVSYRLDVIQSIGPDGWRHVPRPKGEGGLNLAIYGCSFTYGTGLADHETYAARLQAALPDVRVRNRGIGGQSTVQNYLQFRRDIRDKCVDAAIFGIFSDHRFRNVPHPKRMVNFLNEEWSHLGVEHVPVLRQGRHEGAHEIVYVPIWQPTLQGEGFDAFLPDDHMIDAATLTMLDEIRTLGQAHDIPVCFALLDQEDPAFTQAVLWRFDNAIDIAIPLDEDHTFRPVDFHPNPQGAAVYADRLLDPAKALLKGAAQHG